MGNENKDLKTFINEGDSAYLTKFFYLGSKSLENLHRDNLYVTNFNPEHIKYNGESVVFERTDKMTNRIIGDERISNIEAYVSLMAGSYIGYSASLLPFAKLKQFYNDIKYTFPTESEDYLNRSINEGMVQYFHMYTKNRNDLISGMSANSRINVKSKSTPEGRAFSERNEQYKQAAFANVLVVSAIITLILLTAILTYVILK